MNITELKEANAKRWGEIAITPNLEGKLNEVAERLVANTAKTTYLVVAQRTTVPWWVIAVIHEREAGQSWLANLANGDPWSRMTIHVPRGRGPFTSWASAAIDALMNCAPMAARWNDWSAGGTLTLLEEYNGLGYAERGLPSPYVWASTNQYARGKYIADGHFDPNAVDHQLGCAALLVTMGKLDNSVKLGG